MRGLSGWGGKRKGAGRKNRSNQINHMKRETFDTKTPLQITMKLKAGLPSLRTRRMLEAFRKALLLSKARGMRTIHYSLESNHFHLFVESGDMATLGAGMKSFGSSFGKAVRKLAGGRGSVFAGRYHMRVLRNPSQTRNSLAYVLLNRFKHEKSHVDDNPFSSAQYFSDWRVLLGRSSALGRKIDPPDYLSAPKSWLAREGWRKAPREYRLRS